MLINIHNAPTKGNFCNQQGNTMKPLNVEDYNCHMDYVHRGWLTATPSALQHKEVDKEIVLPCVRSTPNSCIAMW